MLKWERWNERPSFILVCMDGGKFKIKFKIIFMQYYVKPYWMRARQSVRWKHGYIVAGGNYDLDSVVRWYWMAVIKSVVVVDYQNGIID